MDNRILDIIIQMKNTYGEDIFYNTSRAKNILADLAPGMKRERLQVQNILELDGYNAIKNAGDSYQLIRNNLIETYSDLYCVDKSAAAWAVDLFGAALGHIDADRYELAAAQEKNTHLKPDLKYRRCISAGVFHTVALKKDGTVLAAGNNESGQCDIGGWKDIIAVSAGSFHTVGVRKDGTAVAVGDNDDDQCGISGWKNITMVFAAYRHTVGLRGDGTVVACGRNTYGECDVEDWRNIVDIAAGPDCTFGIKKDGTVLARGAVRYDLFDVSDLTGVAAISGGARRLYVLGRDGDAFKAGRGRPLRIWKNRAAIAAGGDFLAGLEWDGTVRLLEYYWQDSGIECNMDDWRGITAIAAGSRHVVGLKSDGGMTAALMSSDPNDNEGQCDVTAWSDIGLPE